MKPPICRLCGMGHWGSGHIWPKSGGFAPAVIESEVSSPEPVKPRSMMKQVRDAAAGGDEGARAFLEVKGDYPPIGEPPTASARLEVARAAEAAVRSKPLRKRVVAVAPSVAMSEIVSGPMPAWALPSQPAADAGVPEIKLLAAPEAEPAAADVAPVAKKVLKPRTEKRRAYFAEYMRTVRAAKKAASDGGGEPDDGSAS